MRNKEFDYYLWFWKNLDPKFSINVDSNYRKNLMDKRGRDKERIWIWKGCKKERKEGLAGRAPTCRRI